MLIKTELKRNFKRFQLNIAEHVITKESQVLIFPQTETDKMLYAESPHQGIYAPLSQAMTDSESDEEVLHRHNQISKQRQKHSSEQVRRTGNRAPPRTLALKQQHSQNFQRHLPYNQSNRQDTNSQAFQTFQTTLATNKSGKEREQQPSSYTTNMQNTFRSVMMSDIGMNVDGGIHCDPTVNFSNFNGEYDERNQTDADNVAILGNSSDEKITEPMSPSRRCCFIFSLLLCLFSVIGFVWLVPCREGNTCPALSDRMMTHNWFNNYSKIELKGDVHVVSGLRNWENNLIFLYRGDSFFPEFRPSNTKRNGIISLIGSSGAVAWFDEMTDEPLEIDCTLIDVNRDGRPDCLVIDEYGELGAISPLSGQWLWRFKERAAQKISINGSFHFPIILPDLDDDGVTEILIVSSAGLEERTKTYVRRGDIMHDNQTQALEARNILRILSGRTGRPIGEGLKMYSCDALRELRMKTTQSIGFTCYRRDVAHKRSMTIAELYALITNKSIPSQKLAADPKISQHRHFGPDLKRKIYSLSGRELMIHNRGKCPEDCNVTLILSETRNGRTSVLRNFTESAMYGMMPAQWHFKNTKSKMSGFVLKFWRWNELHQNSIANHTNSTGTHQNSSTSAKKSKPKENSIKFGKQNQTEANQTKKNSRKQKFNHEFATPGEHFNTFDHLIKKRQSYTLPTHQRVSRSAPLNSTNNKLAANEKYQMHVITETVVLVIFIGGDTRIENTSQSTIVQFCRNDAKDVICQPDLNNQENSMLIADLDEDGSQELVSYMSTFVQDDNAPQNWKLLTYVRLLRLESELPAFYEEEKHN